MPISGKTNSGEWWLRLTSYGSRFSNGQTARRIICEGAGNLYLIPASGTAGAGTLFFTGAVAGQTFDVQCDGIGSGTTCSAVVAQG